MVPTCKSLPASARHYGHCSPPLVTARSPASSSSSSSSRFVTVPILTLLCIHLRHGWPPLPQPSAHPFRPPKAAVRAGGHALAQPVGSSHTFILHVLATCCEQSRSRVAQHRARVARYAVSGHVKLPRPPVRRNEAPLLHPRQGDRHTPGTGPAYSLMARLLQYGIRSRLTRRWLPLV